MDKEGNGKGGAFSQVKETRAQSKTMIRSALKGALATVHKDTGHPYASLVLTATDCDGSPILLISKLALHTQNLAGDNRASLLIDATGNEHSPMEGARITLIGEVGPVQSETARARFLARHPSAGGYADFPDFDFFQLTPVRAHFIGGFGRIVDLEADDLLLPLDGVEELFKAEAEIVAHMNEDHADAIELYATKLSGAPAGAWQMTGIDPEGCDLILGSAAVRVPFETHVRTASEARAELVRLVGVAREKAA